MEIKKFYWFVLALLLVGMLAAQCGAPATQTAATEAAKPTAAVKPTENAPVAETTRATTEAKPTEAKPTEAVKATGITIKLIDDAESHGLALQALAKKYEEMTGTKVEVEILPYDATYEKEVLMFSTSGSDYDLVAMDCIWVTQFQKNGWLLDIMPYVNDPKMPKLDVNSFVPGLIDGFNRRGDKLYGIPIDFTNMQLAYRTDLFKEAGLESPPKTWAEFADYAQKLTKTKGDGTVEQYGFVWMGGIPDSAHSEWLMRIAGSKLPEGQTEFMFNADVTKTVFMNNDIGVNALQKLLDVKQYAPPGSPGYGYGEGIQAFAQGQAAMFISWQSMFGDFNNPEKSSIAGKVAYAPHPSDEETNYYVGGWQMAVNAKSKNPEEAYKFLAWIGSDEGQLAMIEAGSPTPYKQFIFNDEKYLKENPVFVATQQVSQGKHVMALPLTTHYVEMQQIMFEQLQAAFTGVKTPKDALEQASKEIDALLMK